MINVIDQEIGQGSIKDKLPSSPIAIISNILYVPILARKLLSLSQILEKESNFVFTKGLLALNLLHLLVIKSSLYANKKEIYSRLNY